MKSHVSENDGFSVRVCIYTQQTCGKGGCLSRLLGQKNSISILFLKKQNMFLRSPKKCPGCLSCSASFNQKENLQGRCYQHSHPSLHMRKLRHRGSNDVTRSAMDDFFDSVFIWTRAGLQKRALSVQIVGEKKNSVLNVSYEEKKLSVLLRSPQ